MKIPTTDAAKVFGTCIRFDQPKMPYIHHNGNHTTVGLDLTKGNGLGWELTPLTGDPDSPGQEIKLWLERDANGDPRNIIAPMVDFDESMSDLRHKGWTVGASGGVGYLLIRFRHLDSDGVVRTKKATHDSLYMLNNFWNVWVLGFFIDQADVPLVPGQVSDR